MTTNHNVDADQADLERIAALTKYVTGGVQMTEAGIKRAEAAQGERVMMNEWANSIAGRPDDRGQIMEQPFGAPVDNSLMRYLDAKPKKVQVAENTDPNRSVLEDYRAPAGKAAVAEGAVSSANAARERVNARRAAIGGERRTRIMEAAKAKTDDGKGDKAKANDDKAKSDKAMKADMVKAAKAALAKIDKKDREGISLDFNLSPTAKSDKSKIPSGVHEIFEVASDSGTKEAAKVLAQIGKLIAAPFRVKKLEESDFRAAGAIYVGKGGKESVSEAVMGYKEQVKEQLSEFARGKVELDESAESGSDYKDRVRAELKESARLREASGDSELAARIDVRRQRALRESSDYENPHERMRMNESAEREGASRLDEGFKKTLSIGPDGGGSGPSLVLTASGEFDLTDEDRKTIGKAFQNDSTVEWKGRTGKGTGPTVTAKRKEDVKESASARREEEGRSIMEGRNTGDLPHPRTWNGGESLNENAGDGESLNENAYEDRSPDPAMDARVRELINAGNAGLPERLRLSAVYESAVGGYAMRLASGKGPRVLGECSNPGECVKFLNSWIDGVSYLESNGNRKWAMVESEERGGKWAVVESNDHANPVRREPGQHPEGHVHATYGSKLEADAYTRALIAATA